MHAGSAWDDLNPDPTSRSIATFASLRSKKKHDYVCSSGWRSPVELAIVAGQRADMRLQAIDSLEIWHVVPSDFPPLSMDTRSCKTIKQSLHS